MNNKTTAENIKKNKNTNNQTAENNRKHKKA